MFLFSLDNWGKKKCSSSSPSIFNLLESIADTTPSAEAQTREKNAPVQFRSHVFPSTQTCNWGLSCGMKHGCYLVWGLSGCCALRALVVIQEGSGADSATPRWQVKTTATNSIKVPPRHSPHAPNTSASCQAQAQTPFKIALLVLHPSKTRQQLNICPVRFVFVLGILSQRAARLNNVRLTKSWRPV